MLLPIANLIFLACLARNSERLAEDSTDESGEGAVYRTIVIF